MQKKSPHQLQALDQFYSEQNYPTPKQIEEYAESLGLTFKQVRGWFVEKRRRDRRDNMFVSPPRLRKNLMAAPGSNRMAARATEKLSERQDPSLSNGSKMNFQLAQGNNYVSTVTKNNNGCRKKNQVIFQALSTPDYILKKVFRKDGPPLGVEFDSLPSTSFSQPKGPRNTQPSYEEKQRANKRRKVLEGGIIDSQDCSVRSLLVKKHGVGKGLISVPSRRHGMGKGLISVPSRRHGMGKGLMTVWQAVNPNGGNLPSMDLPSQRIPGLSPLSATKSQKARPQKKRAITLVSKLKQKRLEKRTMEKKKPFVRRKKQVELNNESHEQPHKEKCELGLDGAVCKESLDQFAVLVDDEELEIRESQTGANPLACSDHLFVSGRSVCSLCKDMLSKFPPNSVKMKMPFGMEPWSSSSESIKKLFKVLHFLYTYSVTLDVCPFTLDEFARAFHDKDSLLLGKIHVSLLKLLLLDVEMELNDGTFPRSSVSCRFLALLHSVETQILILDVWKNSLNPLTWSEILRQVLIAAGFGSNRGASRRQTLSKEMNLMVKNGLHPGTLKGEIFKLLSEQGNNGLKVADLANSSQIGELHLASTNEELERLICSTLLSDISLFEKISSSAYRLRANSYQKEIDDFQLDDEEYGTVDDDSNDCCTSTGLDDSESDSARFSLNKVKTHRKLSKSNILTIDIEIDESHPGEPWLLGLMEGEYSDLGIEEKLNLLVGLIDILSAGSTIRMKNPSKGLHCIPSTRQRGSGAKIKRSTSNVRPSWVHAEQMHDGKEAYASLDSRPVDSSSVLNFYGGEKLSNLTVNAEAGKVGVDVHPMQSIYLGSDRRYNRYWLFLGPCNSCDPGHKRVYFESSEDGHWEVIDSQEALRALLSVLDDRGKREAPLIESLEKREACLCQAMSSRLAIDAGGNCSPPSDTSQLLDTVRENSSSPVSDIDNNVSVTEMTNNSLPPNGAIVLKVDGKREAQNKKWSRLHEFDAWIWGSFYSTLNAVKLTKCSYLESLAKCGSCHDLYWRDEKHCKICHTTFELDFDLEERYAIHVATCREKSDLDMSLVQKVLPSQLQSLKAALHAIESNMPEEALVGAWRKSAHRLWGKRLRRTSSLSELLQVISDFVGAINEDWLWRCHGDEGSSNIMEEIISCFPSLPQTSSAVALWLVKLDALIGPYLKKAQSERNQ